MASVNSTTPTSAAAAAVGPTPPKCATAPPLNMEPANRSATSTAATSSSAAPPPSAAAAPSDASTAPTTDVPAKGAPVKRVALDSFYIPSFISAETAQGWYRKIEEQVLFLPRNAPELLYQLYGKLLQLPRDKAFYGELKVNIDGIEIAPCYRYGAKIQPRVERWAPILKEIRDALQPFTKYQLNHLVVNRYNNGNDHIGYHQDKTRDFMPGAPVVTLSLGATRTFDLQQQPPEEGVPPISLELENGSVFILGGKTNDTYKHRIKAEKGAKAAAVGPRISLTYRSIQTMAEQSNGEVRLLGAAGKPKSATKRRQPPSDDESAESEESAKKPKVVKA